MQSTTLPLSSLYREAVYFTLRQQVPFALLCLLLLDGGRPAKVCGIAMLGFWVGAVMIISHRPTSPNPGDLAFLRWGFWPTFALAIILAKNHLTLASRRQVGLSRCRGSTIPRKLAHGDPIYLHGGRGRQDATRRRGARTPVPSPGQDRRTDPHPAPRVRRSRRLLLRHPDQTDLLRLRDTRQTRGRRPAPAGRRVGGIDHRAGRPGLALFGKALAPDDSSLPTPRHHHDPLLLRQRDEPE